VEQENAFFKSSPVDEYHLPQNFTSENFVFVVLKALGLDHSLIGEITL
jgi:hypothetical protein